jgi:hypothetical protein
MAEKRQFQRAEFNGAVEVHLAGGRSFVGHIRDLSVGGAYVLASDKLAFGTEVQLKVQLPALSHRGSSTLDGVVRWVREDGFGVQFGPTGALDTYALAEYVARKTNQL